MQALPKMHEELPSPPNPLSVKHATIENLFNVSYWLWRLNPYSIFPVMLNSAVDVLKQSIVVTALMAGLFQLTPSGVFVEIAEAIRAGEISKLLSTISQIMPEITFIVVISTVMFFLASVIASGFLNSAEYGSYIHLLRNGTLSISNVLEEMKIRWAKMAWTVLVVELVKYGPVLLALGWVFFDIVHLPSTIFDPSRYSLIISKLFLWLGIVLFASIFTLAITVLTIYAYPAAVDGSYGFSAVKRSLGVCAKLPVNTIVYCGLRALSLMLIGFVALLAGLLGVQLSSTLAIILSFIVVPVFHIFKTAVFLKAQLEPVSIPLPIGPPILEDIFSHVLRTGLERIKKGLYELCNFLTDPQNVVFHFFSIIAFSSGVLLGGWVSSSGIRQIFCALGYVPRETNALFENIYGLPFLAFDISFHNWQVSLATALSGIAFVVPVLTTLIFNGFILGVVEDVVQNLTLFLAAILPHGVIEIPAFIVAGSTGLNLGFKFFKALVKGNPCSDLGFHKALRRTIYITFGLVPIFIVAGVVEAFITPNIMRLYGWK